jgi:DNA-binding NtrC family response regulator
MGDLSQRLRFCPTDGRIWLDDQRMLLLHLGAFTDLRKGLINGLGVAAARGLLTRMGYASGCRDAELALKLRPDDPVHSFSAGPQLHALEGIVHVERVALEMDAAAGHFHGEYLWHASAEVDAHLAAFGLSAEPVCWMQIGYATGYASMFMGFPVLFREVECRGTGARTCRIVGKPVHEWDDPAPDMIYFQPDGVSDLVAREACPPADVLAPAPEAATAPGLVGVSSGFKSAYQLLQRVARTGATVLFLGETGVGKEMFARTLHELSDRAAGPFIAINCSAIPENLIESELFGVERGAFTGAVASRPGRFERANGGTIFLDEIGNLNLAAQGKLLRVLQEREYEPVGGTATRRVDVRVVAATNVDLREEMRAGRFREDLFFRLNVFPVRIPPLRERRDDIPPLVSHFLRKYSARYAKKVGRMSDRALDRLLDYGFPGNVRELENIIERAVIMAPEDGGAIDVAHLFVHGEEVGSPFLGVDGDGSLVDGWGKRARDDAAAQPVAAEVIDEILSREMPLEVLEDLLIEAAVERTGGNLSEAARRLGLTRPQLAYRYRKGRE